MSRGEGRMGEYKKKVTKEGQRKTSKKEENLGECPEKYAARNFTLEVLLLQVATASAATLGKRGRDQSARLASVTCISEHKILCPFPDQNPHISPALQTLEQLALLLACGKWHCKFCVQRGV